MRHILFIILFIGSIIAGGFYLERAADFQTLKNDLQNLSIPSPHLNFGKRGQLMRKLGIEYSVPDNYLKYFNPETGEFSLKGLIKLDTVGQNREPGWTSPHTVAPEKIPSTVMVDPKNFSGDIPVMSIVIDKEDLYSLQKGIFANAAEKGRQWERFCYISFFENGKLSFATGTGARVHGGNLRRGPVKSLRFYFREIYGVEDVDAGIFFDDEKDGKRLRRIILRKEPVFLNALALDIAGKLGCIVPETRPVKAWLNGEPYGPNYQFVITEHLSKSFLKSNFGYDDFVFVRTQPENVRRPREYEKLIDWANNTDKRMTMAAADRYINLENFSLWWISQIYTANTSIYQGLALRENKDPKKWFWVNWDMDNAFINENEPGIKIWEQELIVNKVMNNRYHRRPRAVVFRRLMREDPQYRKYFESLLTEKLNHALTRDYLRARTDYYESIHKQLDSGTEFPEGVRAFFDHRHEFLFKMMRKHFESPESYYCRVQGDTSMTYNIDGFPSQSGYQGIYFKGASIRINIVHPSSGKKLDHWMVNGQRVEPTSNGLIHIIETDTVIQPVFVALS